MMSIVSGADFIQEIPDYYAEQGAEYNDLHRMPPTLRTGIMPATMWS